MTNRTTHVCWTPVVHRLVLAQGRTACGRIVPTRLKHDEAIDYYTDYPEDRESMCRTCLRARKDK